MGFKLIYYLVFFFISSIKANSVEKIGDVLQIALPVSAGLIAIDKKDRVGVKQFVYGFSSTLAITYFLKATINNKRPNGGPHSFPSGHTSAAFSPASFLWYRYGAWYGAPAFILASYVGYSRVHANKHWVKDVLAGAALGIGTSYFFTTPWIKVNVSSKQAALFIVKQF